MERSAVESHPATGANSRLAALVRAGTAVWVDDLDRAMLRGGELDRLVELNCVSGVTTNPAIFERALAAGRDYDDELAELARSGQDADALVEALTVSDVRAACDRLAPIFAASVDSAETALAGPDGFVSIEVSPHLARDGEATLSAARRLWELVARPNVMIKIPGTEEGLAAIEEALFEGINVNVTLLFSVATYERVAEAYVRAMERRAAAGRDFRVWSVASFFVSRVDTEVDRRLRRLGRDDLRGRAAVANARAAYRAFERIFLGERFAALRARGCPVQRPLWASTGVKDPAYPETKYVAELVAPYTVSTMPRATLAACARELEVTADTARIDPADDLAALADAGIDLEEVAAVLLEEGIEKFVRPYERTLTAVARKAVALAGTAAAVVPDRRWRTLASADDRRAESEWIVRALLAGDASTLGDPSTPELADRLGWVRSPARELAALGERRSVCRELAGDADAVVLLGMGGSSLGAAALAAALGIEVHGPLAEQRPPSPGERKPLYVLDSTHPRAVRALEGALEGKRPLFVVASKSGTTVETRAQMDYFLGRSGQPERFVAITDPGTPLDADARTQGFAHVFHGDPEIGGRYSVLSPFGTVPALLCGSDPEPELRAAVELAERLADEPRPAATLAAALAAAAAEGSWRLLVAAGESDRLLALWLEQLIAESSGKQGRGILPVPLTAAEDGTLATPSGALLALPVRAAGGARAIAPVPGVPLAAVGGEALGAALYLWEVATAAACALIGVNPFDQPNVQEAKDASKRALARRERPRCDEEAAAVQLIRSLAPPAYLAIQAYLPESPELDAAASELCRTVVERTGCAATFGYGPRYLHSTGQLHKGGPPVGAFLQLVDGSDGDELAIAERDHGFRALIDAQAAGDRAALEQRGRRVVTVAADGDPARLLRKLGDALAT